MSKNIEANPSPNLTGFPPTLQKTKNRRKMFVGSARLRWKGKSGEGFGHARAHAWLGGSSSKTHTPDQLFFACASPHSCATESSPPVKSSNTL